MEHILSLRHLSKHRVQGGGFELNIEALDVARGELVALVGPSGCGKSTALDLMAAVLRPDSGRQFAFCPRAGQAVDVLDLWQRNKGDALASLRRRYVGYVLQTGGLLPFLSGRENITLACDGKPAALEALAHTLGITPLLDKKPALMSVGERQRFAIARALASEPELVLADEPVASLDPLNAQVVMRLFTHLARERGITVIMVSHAPAAAAEMGFRLISATVRRQGDGVCSLLGGAQ